MAHPACHLEQLYNGYRQSTIIIITNMQKYLNTMEKHSPHYKSLLYSIKTSISLNICVQENNLLETQQKIQLHVTV